MSPEECEGFAGACRLETRLSEREYQCLKRGKLPKLKIQQQLQRLEEESERNANTCCADWTESHVAARLSVRVWLLEAARPRLKKRFL